MKLSDFNFELPEELIAQHPPEIRGQSRLLDCSNLPLISDRAFSDIVELIQPNDCLLLNNTKVIKARLQATKESGGKLEVMIERILDDKRFTAMIRASHSPKPSSTILIAGVAKATVVEKTGMMYCLELQENGINLMDLLEQHGALPLPPYITHTANQEDDQRYQTVFAKHEGAVAAPTAGLHFTESLLNQIRAKGAQTLDLTLHVGAGTFLPVKTDNVADHVMHKERFHIEGHVIQKLIDCKNNHGRVVCVGTTSLRAIEAWATETKCDLNTAEGLNKAEQYVSTGYHGDTDIFITPGYQFKVVDCLQTNFHLPKSTLLMLVSAFAGQNHIFKIYQHAIERQYRFFSYGDAMWLNKAKTIS
jgi:S-adenosylmethionine:tRNA ribosyltransferase-isomerase